MSKVEIALIAIGVFVGTGFLAYVVEAIIFRNRGTIGTYESLFEYFRKTDQKSGNIAALVWAIIWFVLLVLAACIIYLAA